MRAKTFEANLLRHFQRVEAENKNKKRKGVPKEAPPMAMPRHGLWSNDTIISSARIQSKSGTNVQDESNDESEEEDNEGHFQLPDYLQRDAVRNHAV